MISRTLITLLSFTALLFVGCTPNMTQCDPWETVCSIENGCELCRHCREEGTNCIGELECKPLPDCRSDDTCASIPDTTCDHSDGVCKLSIPESCETHADCGIVVTYDEWYNELPLSCIGGTCVAASPTLGESCQDDTDCVPGLEECDNARGTCQRLYHVVYNGYFDLCGPNIPCVETDEIPLACPLADCTLCTCTP